MRWAVARGWCMPTEYGVGVIQCLTAVCALDALREGRSWIGRVERLVEVDMTRPVATCRPM